MQQAAADEDSKMLITIDHAVLLLFLLVKKRQRNCRNVLFVSETSMLQRTSDSQDRHLRELVGELPKIIENSCMCPKDN